MTRSFPALLYHNVGPRRPGVSHWMTVGPGEFARQLEWLRRRRYRSLSTAELVEWAAADAPVPARSVLLTFDDGFADLAETAFPLLIRAGFTAIVFIVTGYIGATNDWDQRFGRGSERLLDAEAIRHWRRAGIEFGAHTRSHPDLTTLPAGAAEEEIAGSRADLEELLQEPVRTFAYPFGAADDVTRRIAAHAYPVAAGVEEGVNRPGVDAHAVRRTMVDPSDRMFDLASRVRLGWSPRQRAHAWAARSMDRLLSARKP